MILKQNHLTICRNFSTSSYKCQALETLNRRPSTKIRVFTENMVKNIPSFKFPLKLSASTLPHSCYTLPFYFDKSQLLSYRVQAFARDFFLNEEQRKYYIGYDLGVKQHLHLSSNPFLNFKRFSSFGKLSFAKATMIHFFTTLSPRLYLYAPCNKFQTGSFIKTGKTHNSYGWHLDILPDIFKKRLSFTRKLYTQNEDLDLNISASQYSWVGAFAKYPSASTLGLLMPTRYNSFIISSYTQLKRLAFPYRFFRYFHKYFMRKNFWSTNLSLFWKRLHYSNNILMPAFINLVSFQESKLLYFFDLKLLVVLFLLCAKVFVSLTLQPLGRIFWYYIFCQDQMLLIILANIFLNFNKGIFKNAFPLLAIKTISTVVYSKNQVYSNYNKLFEFGGVGPKAIKKYLVIDLGQRLNVFCQHGYYRPWAKRFVFSLKNFNFLKVFPKSHISGKRNAIAHPRLRKDITRYNWKIFNPFGKLQMVVLKWWRKLLITFLRNQGSTIAFFNKIPFLLGRFFKFARAIFNGGNTYTGAIFNNKYVTKYFIKLGSRNKERSLRGNLFLFNAFSQKLAAKILSLRMRSKKSMLRSSSRLYKVMAFYKKYSRWERFFGFFNLALRRFIVASPANTFLSWRFGIFPLALRLKANSFPLTQWIRSSKLSGFYLGKVLLTTFYQGYGFSCFPRIFFRRQLVRQFVNNAHAELLNLYVRRKNKPAVFYTTLRLFFQALNSFPAIGIWWKTWSVNNRLTTDIYQYFYSRLNILGVLDLRQGLWNNFWNTIYSAYKLTSVFSLELLGGLAQSDAPYRSLHTARPPMLNNWFSREFFLLKKTPVPLRLQGFTSTSNLDALVGLQRHLIENAFNFKLKAELYHFLLRNSKIIKHWFRIMFLTQPPTPVSPVFLPGPQHEKYNPIAQQTLHYGDNKNKKRVTATRDQGGLRRKSKSTIALSFSISSKGKS